MDDEAKKDREGGGRPGASAEGSGEGAAPVLPTQAELRRERAAQKLRENLQRRKQQLRARRAGQADETNGLPAAKMDESS